MTQMLDPAARSRLYGFFSRLFVREVDDGFAAVLTGDLGRALLPSFAESAEARDLAGHRGEIDADYVHLTVVDLVPYESFHRRDDAMIESGPESPVARFYRRYGFEADLVAGRVLSPDHLGVELELLAVLCDREARAAASGEARYVEQIRGVERAFLREHLLAWAPIYLLAAQRNARTALYADGAEGALDFLFSDHESLSAGGEPSGTT